MIVFPINTLENISEQLLLPGNVKKTVLGIKQIVKQIK